MQLRDNEVRGEVQLPGAAMRIGRTQIHVKGKPVSVRSVQIDGRTVITTDGWLKIASVQDEDMLECETVASPLSFIHQLRQSDLGAATSKNMLGAICLVSGLLFFWDTLTRWPERKHQRTKQIILLNLALIAMTLWLLHLADSATSRVCLLLGCIVIAATHSKVLQRRPGILKGLIPAFFCLYVVLAFGFNMNGELAGAVGRNPTLTDRTKIWQILLSMHTNPLIGTGYQSFWLGSRLQWFWQNSGLGHINEAHNGHLQVYLNLGLIGVFLLAGFLIAGYRNICRKLSPSSKLAALALAVWTILVFYNMSEAAFEGGLLWMMLLMGAVVLPQRSTIRVRNAATLCNAETLAQLPLEATGVPTDRALRSTFCSVSPSVMREVGN